MPFIGNQPALSYTSFAKQDFTTSATTSYTLDNSVANENEIALFINFVRQEPTTAYSASGTTLTLTSATSASDDMYCVFLGKAVQTVTPASGSVTNDMISYPLAKSGATVSTFNRTTDNGDILELQKDGTNVGSIGIETDGFYIDGETNHTGLQFSGGQINPRDNGSVTDGTNDLGNASARWRDLYLGGGLYVGGTGTANKLDDYEEGTFTPILKGSPSPTSVTYAHQVGKYTKVGNKVTVNYYLETTGYSGGGGALELDGLPFTVASSTYNWSVGSITFYAVAQFNETVARANANTTYLTVFGRDTLTISGTWGNKNLSDWKSSGTSAAMATITYFTD